MKNNERKKNIYLSIGLIIFALCVTGATYAYFALTASNNFITGTVGGATLKLTVTKVVPTSATTNMIPQLESTLGDAISSSYNCVDENGNVVCQVYKATITNNGDTSAELTGTISFTNINNMPNLKWMRLDNATTIGTYTSSYATTSEAVFEETKLFAPDATQDYYFVIWIDETGELQTDTGTFRATINFNTADGDGLTSTIRPGANVPNIDNGNLIPVYYDNSDDKWKKADSSNAGNSWYDYDNKEWANAVLIKDNATRATYQAIGVNEEVPESVIDAFYVWIPRYKYRVWNITRQGGNESTYAYPAFSEGIDIEWEYGTESTGNVECEYDVMTEESETNLSDECVYNGTDTITTESGNSNYTDAWYTHPAFDFGGVPKTGFWMGKFETGGSASVPKIIPDVSALVSQVISAQFTTSKVFQTYGLSDNVDAHMVTNLEWGAVAYLTQSLFGLCDENGCRDAYINNSNFYTGRSGGGLAKNVSYTNYGNYNYKGYKMNSGTVSTTEKDVSKVASNTGNITGVYDMSGGAYEPVMGNMVDSNGNFYPSYSESNWNGSATLDPKYYDSYSYSSSSYNRQIAWNRARLGDATAEVTGSNIGDLVTWLPGYKITGGIHAFVRGSNSWFQRSGYSSYSSASIFYVYSNGGGDAATISFRSSIV